MLFHRFAYVTVVSFPEGTTHRDYLGIFKTKKEARAFFETTYLPHWEKIRPELRPKFIFNTMAVLSMMVPVLQDFLDRIPPAALVHYPSFKFELKVVGGN